MCIETIKEHNLSQDNSAVESDRNTTCLFVCFFMNRVESHFELNSSWTQTNSWLGLFVELSYNQYRTWCLVLFFPDISFIYRSSLLLCDFWWIPIEIRSCLVFGNHPGSCFKYTYFWLLRSTQRTSKNLSFSDAVWLTKLFLMEKCVWYSFTTHCTSQKQWRMSTEVLLSLDQSV